MNFRTSHLVGLIATGIVAIAAPSINPVAAEPLKITGPDGQVKQSIRQYGPTTSADTFWSIAQTVKPDNSVTIYQVMSALYDANPHAFASKNYNSLERGMILLVPTKAVMLQTSQADAKSRAERSDRRWSSASVVPKPSVAAKVVAPTSVTPKASVTPNLSVAAKSNPLIAELSAEVEALTKQMEESQAQNLALTDELARASDEIVVGSSDTEAFQQEIAQLKEENALLKQALQDSKSENEALDQELQLKQQQLSAINEPKQEPTSDLWRTIMDNPLLLVLGAVLPALIVVALFWLFIRRRNDANTEEPVNEEAAIEKQANVAQEDDYLDDKFDDADGLAVHLDTDDSSDMDVLKRDADASTASSALAEEQDIVVEDSQDEGQSLDDLWAEAMGEQEQSEADEFDAFNRTSANNESSSSDEDDLDSLLAGFDEPAERDSKELSTEAKDHDLDALLAGFDNDETEVVQLEPTDTTDVSAEDDLDSLLASFDESDANSSVNSNDESVLDAKDDFAFEADANAVTDTAAEDDVDALLAGFDETTTELSSAVAAEDDIDALLADFDSSNQQPEPVAESVTAADVKVDDDLDSLLAELEGDEKSHDDSNEPKDIDALSDEIAAELELGFEIAAELDLPASDDADQDKLDSELDSELEALLADLEAPSEEGISADTKLDLDAELESESEVGSELTQQVEPAFEPLAEQTVEAEQSVEAEAELNSQAAEELASINAKDSNSLDFELTEFNHEPNALSSTALNSEVDSLDAEATESKAAEAKADDMLEFTLPESDVEPDTKSSTGSDTGSDTRSDLVSELETAIVKNEKESGFFDDLKGDKKPEENSLDWESIANLSDTDDETVAISASVELSDDELLSSLTAEDDSQERTLEIADDDAFSLDDDPKMTVDEALAALDAEEQGDKAAGKSAVAMHDLTTFQRDNGFIDIDMLLSEADEDSGDTDLYKELDVDMGELNSLMGNSPMVDVDDEENSVNAKLDLARAYIEIDDNDSARALLKEVELDGNDRQQAEAMGLLKELV
ncbi:conserved hypothetical protein [Shewanella halifaxensis HAW-EB4]|uniref:FimV N-terminal domain n=1 Tax=Shewanella halifaxensis (strain HAW-EB4) TaxID=458817 RepID=B0TKZ5_SHEHH|nr:FimV/HubP family polar landmark protein [Shewanella halifaxensis]ABZ77197.1 conserved hypothetical protein [Shewanella halifaxensis HAW-EB4]